ncbi:NUDIX hydrolase [Coraliomargarita akajimensis]|uniref:NUDIX hydrolase n=1 Tax=Coraliomargarita akajimensis (strain DSM 45221 / IAM 15411 / JCM 23193 / KCTC 12865 / 04OKA010-24) TaxID=583355 RepID=D5EJB2_CORAD|nr:NUDIX domain-containing protein [Coraliomargarita akajimensis]ADE54511.1 NUDIX hydrolase [Coraliomargarita akajimensis DSM 45221]
MCDYQVGVFPVTADDKLVLVTTRTSGYWIFPKGNVEPGRSDRDVARDEAYEEAGAVGALKSDYYEFETPQGKENRLRLYPMKVKELLKHFPEADERERMVVSFDKAEKMVEKDLREIIRKMRKKYA